MKGKATMYKRFVTSILITLFLLSLSVPAFASENDTMPIAKGYVTVSDPNTGEKWSWELPSSDIITQRAPDISDSARSAEVTVDLGEYILRTMTPPVDTEKVLHDDITITVGLRYSADSSNNTVAIYRAYGSTPTNGQYYATNKNFYYANPHVFGPIHKYPTINAWSYSTNSAPGAYSSDLPPYALLDCRITISGMESSYRDVSVICRLDWL